MFVRDSRYNHRQSKKETGVAAKAITFTEQEKEYLVTCLDQQYENYGRREKLADMPEMKNVFINAREKVRLLRERITKEA